jgi:hypothetical protein
VLGLCGERLFVLESLASIGWLPVPSLSLSIAFQLQGDPEKTPKGALFWV